MVVLGNQVNNSMHDLDRDAIDVISEYMIRSQVGTLNFHLANLQNNP
jgi:hypothetical protein